MFLTDEGFIVRPIREDELEAVLAVYQQCEDFLTLTPTPLASMDMVLADIKLSREVKGDFCGIYNPVGTMMGVVDVIMSGFEDQAETAFIELLMIGQPYRNGGLGAAVVKAVEAEIRRNGTVTRIELGVMVNNPAAVRFWERKGYVQVSEAQLLADGTTALRMGKQIPSP